MSSLTLEGTHLLLLTATPDLPAREAPELGEASVSAHGDSHLSGNNKASAMGHMRGWS